MKPDKIQRFLNVSVIVMILALAVALVYQLGQQSVTGYRQDALFNNVSTLIVVSLGYWHIQHRVRSRKLRRILKLPV